MAPVYESDAFVDPEALQAAELRTLATVLIDRLQFAKTNGLSFGGARDLYEVLGYDRSLTQSKMRDRYARGGIAGRVVDALPKACWRGGFELVEDDDPEVSTTFEKTWVDLEQRLRITSTFRRADILTCLSPFAVILIGAPGALNEELPKGNPKKLLYLTPFGGGGASTARVSTGSDVTIETFETDAASPRFGLPLTYMVRRFDLTAPSLQKPVHWTRILHLAEGNLEDEVYGQPVLERVWNLLDDLDKVTGGGAEAFWLRANQGMHVNLQNATAPIAPKQLEQMRSDIEEYKHQLTRILRTRGADVAMLGSDVANFNAPADAILTQIAGASAIPKRILTGSEMGELASSQDRENWKDQVQGRQALQCEPVFVRQLADRLIAYGYLPEPKAYQVKWASIDTSTAQERWQGAQAWASVNQTQGMIVFTDDEIRDHWEGLLPLTPEQKQPVTQPVTVTDDATIEQGTVTLKTPPKPEPPPAKVDEPAQEVEPEVKAAGSAEASSSSLTDEETDLLHVLEAAVAGENLEVIDRVLGLRHARFDPAQPRDDQGQWTSGGVTRRGPAAESEFLQEPADALEDITEGRAATIAPNDLREVLARAATQGGAPDLVHLTLEGTPLFAGGLNLPRDAMPQIPDAKRQHFLDTLRAQGVRITHERVDPSTLLPAQQEINAAKVGGMLQSLEDNPRPIGSILVSDPGPGHNGRVLDGHHRWATAVAVKVEHPGARLNITRLHVPDREALRLMNAYTRAQGIAPEALQAWRAATLRTAFDRNQPRNSHGEWTHTRGEKITPDHPDVGYLKHTFGVAAGGGMQEPSEVKTYPVDHPIFRRKAKTQNAFRVMNQLFGTTIGKAIWRAGSGYSSTHGAHRIKAQIHALHHEVAKAILRPIEPAIAHNALEKLSKILAAHEEDWAATLTPEEAPQALAALETLVGYLDDPEIGADVARALSAAFRLGSWPALMAAMGLDDAPTTLGNAQSGNHGHAGRPGKRGGSAPRGAAPYDLGAGFARALQTTPLPVIDSDPIGGHHANPVFKVLDADQRTEVFKPDAGVARNAQGEILGANRLNYAEGATLAQREVIAAEIANALGVGEQVPDAHLVTVTDATEATGTSGAAPRPTAPTRASVDDEGRAVLVGARPGGPRPPEAPIGQHGVAMEWVPGRPVRLRWEAVDPGAGGVIVPSGAPRDWANLKVLDTIIGNLDRNAGNAEIETTTKRVIGFDHGYAFTDVSKTPWTPEHGGSVRWDFGHVVAEKAWAKEMTAKIQGIDWAGALKQTPLAPGERQGVLNRVALVLTALKEPIRFDSIIREGMLR